MARLAVTYGPGGRLGDSRVVNALIERSLRDSATRLLDDGAAIRTLIYTRDASELLWRIALEGTEAVYNVAGETLVSVKEIAQAIAEEADCRLEVGTGSGASGAAREVRLDLTRTLGAFPKSDFVGLEDGIARATDWYRSLMRETVK